MAGWQDGYLCAQVYLEPNWTGAELDWILDRVGLGC